MLHAYNVCPDCIGLEYIRHHSTHGTIGRCVGKGFTCDDISVLVNHVGRDGECVISADGSAEWCHNQVGWCPCRDGDVLHTTDESKAG